MYMCVSLLEYICAVYTQEPLESEKGIRTPGTRVIGDIEEP